MTAWGSESLGRNSSAAPNTHKDNLRVSLHKDPHAQESHWGDQRSTTVFYTAEINTHNILRSYSDYGIADSDTFHERAYAVK